MKAAGQTTLRERVELSGIGVHNGLPVTLVLHPAEANTGIVFQRTDGERIEREVRVDHTSVAATEFATVLGDADGPVVSTVEHVLAALHGLGIDNALIEVDGAEVPILDGSAAPFVEAIDTAGIVVLAAPRRYLRILKPIGVTCGPSYGELRPYSEGFRVEVDIDFDHPLVRRQSLALDIEPAVFRRELARARTFGFTADVTRLWDAGFARGASLENTLVLAEDRVLNPDGLRFKDECVRHKALDAIGDLAVAGLPILGAYRSIRGGHRLNYAVLSALFADPTAWAISDAGERVRRPRGHVQMPLAAQPVLAPEIS
ncbi:MAG: UDP-3-O-[3-hydroxymyristoyl] N-acetylglucosamine deacetylase [Variibacter sp.]|jgi:UDP-3-O-[3-hydroxymyristoyl] N-acetylglucosamine deacetylase|nr:UDP-3-O-[3-hydroxymyristoyl] N-acetylglucosamine deacetylase [Variibacter sp.]